MNPFKTLFMMLMTLVVIFGGIYLAGNYYYARHPVSVPQKEAVEMPVNPEPVKQPPVEPPPAASGQGSVVPTVPRITPPSYKSMMMDRQNIVHPLKELTNEEYESIYKSLAEGDQALKGGDGKTALQQYLSAYQTAVGSSMEQVTREKLLWAYERLGQNQSALEQVDWLLKTIDQRSPQYELYSNMKNDLLRKTASTRQEGDVAATSATSS